MRTRRLLLLALLVQAGGCYAYTEASLDGVAPNAEVRVGVGPETAARLRDALAADQRTLEGRVSSREGDALLLDVVVTTRQSGFQFERLSQTLRLEPRDVTYVEVKTLDRGRTYAGIGIAAAAVGAVTWKALRGWTGADTRPPTGGGTSDARVIRPGFRISIPVP